METPVQTPPNGPYRYYEPSPKPRPEDHTRSFSEREAAEAIRASTINALGISAGSSQKTVRPHGDHITDDSDSIPINLRAKAWSPEPTSPQSPLSKPQNASNASAPLRSGSVSERSPLQKLEAELSSKERKRMKAEKAEQRARAKSLADNGISRTLTNGKERVVSDDHRSPPEPVPGLDDESRQSSTTLPQFMAETDETRQANTALSPSADFDAPQAPRRQGSRHRRSDAIVANSHRPYQHSADAPRMSIDQSRSRVPGPTMIPAGPAAERGKAAYEKRKSQSVDVSQTRDESQRDSSLPRQSFADDRPRALERQDRPLASDFPLHANTMSSHQSPTIPKDGDGFQNSTQPAPVQRPKRQVGFGDDVGVANASATEAHHHHHPSFFHRNREQHRTYQATGRPLEEWRSAGTARLTIDDLDLEPAVVSGSAIEDDKAWWEKKNRQSGASSVKTAQASSQPEGAYEEEAKQYRPSLFTKCGPLLRYTGIRKEPARGQTAGDREVWHGSIMLVTEDKKSDYSRAPILRLFAQPMDLLPSPSEHHRNNGQEVPPDVEDPLAGQVKLSRTGRPIYVRPVHDIPGSVDLSGVENPKGLYAATRTPILGPQSVTGPDGRNSQHITFQDRSRVKRRSGETSKKYREVKAARLHVEHGWTFWRFNIEIELGAKQSRIAYRINKGPAIGFWIPAKGETMNIMFHSCNGFSLSVDTNSFSGPDPMWRDALCRHQHRPFHVMIGGGDQIYNDAATRDTELFREWLLLKNRDHKYQVDFTPDMQEELEDFYLERYAMWFSQGLFAMANSQIPMVNIWDDHDIIDGFGSYPHNFMNSPVFTGVGAVAFKYYMLFQHQSLVTETHKEEPSWLLGAMPGPYIHELSRSIFLNLGHRVAFLGLDCRTERMRDEIMSQESYDIIFDRCRDEIKKGETRHLLVLLGVPIAYPRLNFLENILTSRAMDPIKALGRTGALGGFVNKFDGGVEILDDLDDHWTAKHHKAERNWFLQELQELAADLSVRITILGGDVHLGAVGQFYTPKKFGIAKDRDHRYMPNVISSAIVNTPPPPLMADVLNRRNKVHHLDAETDEDMIPMFEHDVDGSNRNNKRLLPRRNYCTIREYVPGSTPPPSPRLAPVLNGDDADDRGRRFPPGSMRRSMSLTRNPAANFVRRLSGRGRRPPVSLLQSPGMANGMQRSQSLSGPPPNSALNSHPPDNAAEDFRPSFHRRPTNLSEKDVRRAAANATAHDDGREPGHVDLENGLDISLNMEIDKRDPRGSTVPYRLLVPALWYQGPADINPLHLKQKGQTLADRFGFGRKKRVIGDDGYSRSPSPEARVHPRTSHEPPVHQQTSTDFGLRRAATDPNQITPNSPAWNRGFTLSGPPVGVHASDEQSAPVLNNPYPQSHSRQNSHFNGRQIQHPQYHPQQQQQQPQHARQNSALARNVPSDEHSMDTDSFLSEEGVSARTPPVRRASKAERFLGMEGDDAGIVPERKGSLWSRRG